MKILPNKTFPHPVLWRNADDYVRRQFQVAQKFSTGDDGCPVLEFNFTTNEESIGNLLRENIATYALEIYCSTTFLRKVFCTREKAGAVKFCKGQLYRRVEVTAFVVCTQDIEKYSSPNFNEEFGDVAFDMSPGDVLATSETKSWWWDTEFLAPLHSVFELVTNENTGAGMFAVDTTGDKVKIYMNNADKIRFEQLRHSSETKSVAMFVYFSAVAEVLRQMKEVANDGGEDKKWYRAIEHKLRGLGRDIDSSSADPFVLAQELLRRPLQLILPPPTD